MNCNLDCLNCKFPDCINDKITQKEINASNVIDLKAIRDNSTDFSKSSIKYNHSYKGKLAQQRYWSSEKGKETRRRSQKTYYHNHSEQIKSKHREEYHIKNSRLTEEEKELNKAKRRERYDLNKDHINEKRREYYALNKDIINAKRRIKRLEKKVSLIEKDIV